MSHRFRNILQNASRKIQKYHKDGSCCSYYWSLFNFLITSCTQKCVERTFQTEVCLLFEKPTKVKYIYSFKTN